MINRLTLARAVLKPVNLLPATSLTTTPLIPPSFHPHHHPTIPRSNTQISRSLTHHQNCTMSCSFIHPYQIQSSSPDSHPIQLACSSFQRSSNTFIHRYLHTLHTLLSLRAKFSQIAPGKYAVDRCDLLTRHWTFA